MTCNENYQTDTFRCMQDKISVLSAQRIDLPFIIIIIIVMQKSELPCAEEAFYACDRAEALFAFNHPVVFVSAASVPDLVQCDRSGSTSGARTCSVA